MKDSIILLLSLVLLLTGCAVSLEKKDLARFENIGVICLLENRLMFTEQGPLPIQIKEKTEEVPDWGISENLHRASEALLGVNFHPVSLEYEPALLNAVFEEHSWPELTESQIIALREIIRDKPVDILVVIKEGYVPLGQIKGHLIGVGLFQKKLFLLKKSVKVHALLLGRVFETSNFKPIAYDGSSTLVFHDFSNHPWSFGLSVMTEQAKQEAKAVVEESTEEALRQVFVKLGLIEAQ